MSKATLKTIPMGSPPPFSLQLIDFGAHPDAALLRLYCSLAKLRDAQDRLEEAIARTEFEIRRRAPLQWTDAR
jgi:hypothetical protein